MTFEEFNKLKPGTKLTFEDLEEIRKDLQSIKNIHNRVRYGEPTNCYCKECLIEYYVHEADMRQPVAIMDCATGLPIKNITEISCGCGTRKISEFLRQL